MHFASKVAALAATAAILAACSGGSNAVTPPADSSSTTPASAAGTRLLSGAVTASNSGDFEYSANPPARPFESGSDVTANALPPPSVCVQVYGLTCYTPSELRTAYNVPSTLDGSGQTIVIIDAYGSPTIQQDLAVFSAVMGLPSATLNVLYPAGKPPAFDASNAQMVGWAGETSLDVEWAHAIAPRAAIDLLVSPSARASDMNVVEDYAVANHLGNVVSMSFGSSEPAIPGGATNKYLQHADALFQQAKNAGITMIASAGDYGATNKTSKLTPQFPASDPLVLSVGGTSLLTSDTGAYRSETVWNDSVASQCPLGCVYGPALGATGGAPSSLFKAPSYQQSLFHATSRQVADVSYNAGTYTSVLVAQSFQTPGTAYFYFVGGTSAGAPQWAGIMALADQSAHRGLGYVNGALYDIAKSGPYSSAFHDVTSGSNGLAGGLGESAADGYDMPTGLGSPNVANLLPALIQASTKGF